MPGTGVRRHLPPLVTLRAFEAAARRRSFTLAADELCVTPSAISLQVRNLEAFLGQPLFVRRARQLDLTEAGMLYYESCRRLLDDLDRATRRASAQPGSRAVITVSTIPTIGTLWLMPRLAAFSASHPDIEVRVVSDLRPVDMQAAGIDVALRAGRLPGQRHPAHFPTIDLVMLEHWEGIDADFAFADVMVPVVSRRRYRSDGPIHHVRDIAGRTLVHTASRPLAWPQWLAARGVSMDAGRDAPRYGHFYIALQAAQTGHGMALIPDVLLDGYPGRNDLEVVLPDIEPVRSAGDYYVLTRSALASRPAIRLFRDWLLAEAAATRAALERPGRAPGPLLN